MKTLYFFLFLLVCFATTAAAQTKAPAQVQPKVMLFYEKPYLHSDRETYAAGDDLWFKAYLVNAKTHQPLETSKNLYVELISPYSEILERLTVRIDKGNGAGDFRLSDSIPNGTYRIRAYTNWMRNFGDNFVFEKEFTVHSLHKTKAEEMAIASATPAKASLDLVATNPHARVAPEEKIQFFPEGGAMVEGVPGLVAFKAEDASGAGIKAAGVVYSSKGDTISRFESTSRGLGSLFITPEPGLTYFVTGTLSNNHPFKTVLPKALTKGLTLRATDTDSATLLITVSTNALFQQEHQGKEFLLVGRHANERNITVSLKLDALQSNFKVAKNLLPPGLTAITLYDEELRPHCERLIFIPQREAPAVTIATDKTVYRPKSNVTVRLKATAKDGAPQQANISVSVVDAGLIPANEYDIRSYLLLQSEVKGKIQQPGQYFDPQNRNRHKQLDLLLLTQGWRDFTWKRIADTTHTIRYLPEQGFTVSGRVRQLFANKSLPGANITLTAFKAKGQKLYSAKTSADGTFFFDGLQLFGKQTIAVNAYKGKGTKAGILKLDSLLAEPLLLREVPLLVLPVTEAFFATQLEVLNRRKTMRRYSLTDTILLGEVEVNTNKVLRMRDGSAAMKTGTERVYVINKKDYPFETLRQFINFHIPEDYAKQEGSVRFYLNNVEMPLEDEQPVDAEEVDTRNVHFRESIYSMRMEKVKKLTLRRMVDIYGKDFFVLYIDATSDALDKEEFNRAIAGVDGYYQAREFYSPNYGTRDNPGIPDVRTTIFWKHTVLTDENGEATITFYNADPAAKILIVAEGITERGEALVGSAAYEVK